MKIRVRGAVLGAAAAALAAAVLAAGCASQGTAHSPAAAAAAAAAAAPAKPTEAVQGWDAGGFEDAISAVAESATPSVVHVDVTGGSLEPPSGSGTSGGPADPAAAQVPVRALGSGIVLDARGYIITNNHVVENADSITVQFHDGAQRAARLVGSDRYTDIAVIQVDDLGSARTARLGDSDSLRVGQWVVAIGSPRGLDWTVTAGIVSATHRAGLSQTAPEGLEDFVQTDTPINPGNSGGPLLNLRAEVVGMNSMIISGGQGSEGLGFAIPSNMVKGIAETLIRDGKVVRGDLGLATQDLTDAIRRGLGLPAGTRGIVVAEALPLGPGAAAGMSAGDVISSFQGTPVTSSAQFNRLVAAAAPGSRITLGTSRAGAARNIDLTVVDQLALVQQRAQRPGYALLGIRVEAVTEDLAKSVGMEKPAGVVVVEVVPGSPADNVGVGNGDIILQVGGAPVDTQEQFRENVGKAIKAGNVVVLIRDAQSGKTGFLEIPVQ